MDGFPKWPRVDQFHTLATPWGQSAMGISDTIKTFLAGGGGGASLTVVGQPLDTIKVRMQTMPTPKPGQSPLYTG